MASPSTSDGPQAGKLTPFHEQLKLIGSLPMHIAPVASVAPPKLCMQLRQAGYEGG